MKKKLMILNIVIITLTLTFFSCEINTPDKNIIVPPTTPTIPITPPETNPDKPQYKVPSPLSPSNNGVSELLDNIYLGYPDKNTMNTPKHEENFLVAKDAYVLSYNKDKHNANWVSWHLSSDDIGGGRNDRYHHEEQFPDTWEVLGTKYSRSGFSRGHMCPNGERNHTDESSYETFSMANIVPQTQGNNGGGWLRVEEYIRDACTLSDKEAYIVSGTWGVGGIGRNGNNVVDNFKDPNGVLITVPAYVWKVALIIPRGTNDVERINTHPEEVESIAIWMPNDETKCKEGEKNWHQYQCSIQFVENVTGYDFFDQLSDVIEEELENENRELDKEIPPYHKI